jgi:dihydrofolate reductase
LSARSRTQYFTASTLDGFIADATDSLDWLLHPDDPRDTTYADFIKEVGAIAMGSNTYEWIRRHMRDTGEPWPYTQPTWVFTTKPRVSVSGAAIEFVHGDVRPVHAAMSAAAEGKHLWVAGGGDLAGQFFDVGLIDDCYIQYSLATLGAGKPLLPRRIVGRFQLTSVRPIGTTMIALHLVVT